MIFFYEKVTRIEGVFSGTLSYIFNEFSTGSSDGPAFSTVVRTARDKGYTVCLSSLRSPSPPPLPLCPSDVIPPYFFTSPPTFGGAWLLGTTSSRRSQRRRRRTQADHPRTSPLGARQAAAASGDLTARRLRFCAHAIPYPRHALSLLRAHGRCVPRRAPDARRTFQYLAR